MVSRHSSRRPQFEQFAQKRCTSAAQVGQRSSGVGISRLRGATRQRLVHDPLDEGAVAHPRLLRRRRPLVFVREKWIGVRRQDEMADAAEKAGMSYNAFIQRIVDE